MARVLMVLLVALLVGGRAGSEEVPGQRLRAEGDISGKVSTFTPARGRSLQALKVEAIGPDIKRVIIHVSPACSGMVGLFYDDRPSPGQLLRGLPDKKPFYVKVIGVGTLDLIPVYK